jgi:hypothetical protein
MTLMEARRAAPWDRQRMEIPAARVIVDFDPGEPVCGWAAREHGPRFRFEGLLAFLALFERLRRGEELDSPRRARRDDEP